MRKMPYTLIFIFVLIVIVFAGCKSFSHKTGDDAESTDPAVVDTSLSEESTTAPAETTTLPAEPEKVTDAQGETVYTPEEVSSIYVELSSIAQAESEAATASTANNGTTKAPAGTTATEKTTAPPATTKKNETTTKAGGSATAPATTAPATTAPSTTAPAKQKNEYDVLRSGKFYLSGSMYADQQTNPVTLAVGDNMVYMQATMDGMTMGFLVADKKTYLLNPDQKTYCEFGSMMSGLLQQAGMMSEDEIMEYIDGLGFKEMQDLDKADEKTTGTVNNKNCDLYIFNKSDGTKTRVYMDGTHLVAFEIANADGTVDSATYIDTLTETIPTLPPSDYTKQNIISFMTAAEEMMGDE